MDEQQEWIRSSELEDRVRELSVLRARFTHPARKQPMTPSAGARTATHHVDRGAATRRRPFAVITGGRSDAVANGA